MSRYPTLFSPLTIKHLRIRNRLLSTSHAPGYAAGGRITERYLRYQEEKARGADTRRRKAGCWSTTTTAPTRARHAPNISRAAAPAW